MTFEQIKSEWGNASPEDLLKAAEAGNAAAQYYFYRQEWDAAFKAASLAHDQWELKLAAAGQWRPRSNPPAALIRTNWDGVAEADIRRQAEAGDVGAQRHITHLESELAMERGRRALVWLKKSADQELAIAEYELALGYVGQTGLMLLPRDVDTFLKLLKKTAAEGYAPAQNRIGTMLITGATLPLDLPAGIEWLRKAADQNHPQALLNLARHYACGNGEPRHSGETVVALLRKAAQAGVAEAQYLLAERCRAGWGTRKDPVEAVIWYRKAAAQRWDDDPKAAGRIRGILASVNPMGEPSPAGKSLGDPAFVEALALYVKALDLEDASAMERIGDHYLQANNAQQDSARAYLWYSRAATQGSAQAVRKRDELKPRLTSAELEQVEQWNKEFWSP